MDTLHIVCAWVQLIGYTFLTAIYLFGGYKPPRWFVVSSFAMLAFDGLNRILN